jgi:gluconokinase
VRASKRARSTSSHPALVESQFAALESPVGEPGVLRVDALAPLAQLVSRAGELVAARHACTSSFA